jgi:hypothetical protein
MSTIEQCRVPPGLGGFARGGAGNSARMTVTLVSSQSADEVRQKIDALVDAVTAAGSGRDDFEAAAAREIKLLQACAAPS